MDGEGGREGMDVVLCDGVGGREEGGGRRYKDRLSICLDLSTGMVEGEGGMDGWKTEVGGRLCGVLDSER